MPEEVERKENTKSKTLEYWLAKATDPYLSESERPQFVQSFCDQVNEELEGPQVACRLLAHKIQSPNAQEALHALNVLEACVSNCGQRFHNEIAKFKFLNEMIRILSPKYLGAQTADRVKQRAIELLYSWKESLRHLPKIKQSYDMLREQEIVTQDPTYMDEVIVPAAASKTQMATFEDEEKSKLLATLLKSKNPEDLQAANRLIKSMVKAEDQKMERRSQRQEHLETASNNARLLEEMIAQFAPESANGQEVEVMKQLADSLQSLRSTLFRYASEAAEGDESALVEVLGINDDVNRAMEEYKSKVEPHSAKIIAQGGQTANKPNAASNTELLTLLNLDSRPSLGLEAELMGNMPSSSSGFSVISDDAMLGGSASPQMPHNTCALNSLQDIFGSGDNAKASAAAAKLNLSESNGTQVQNLLDTPSLVAGTAAAKRAEEEKQRAGLLDLDVLSQTLIQERLPSGTSPIVQTQKQRQKIPMREMTQNDSAQLVESLAALGAGDAENHKPTAAEKRDSDPLVDVVADQASTSETVVENKPTIIAPDIGDLVVPLEEIQPGSKGPMCIFDRQQVRVTLHVTANRPRERVQVLVASITSSCNRPLTDIEFDATITQQGAIIKLQPATSKSLPAFNPIFPQQAITQVLLVAHNEQLTGKLTVDYTLGYSASLPDGGVSSHSVSGSFEVSLDGQ